MTGKRVALVVAAAAAAAAVVVVVVATAVAVVAAAVVEAVEAVEWQQDYGVDVDVEPAL